MAKQVTVSVTAKVGGIEYSKEFDWKEPLTLDEAEELYGDKAFKACVTKLKTNFQDDMRKKLEKAIGEKIAEKVKSGEIQIDLD